MKNTFNYGKKITYKEQLIIEYNDNTASAFLYDEDGDLVEYPEKSLAEAKNTIDRIMRINKGYYDAYGDLISY